MAYKCPRYGDNVQRGSNAAAGIAGGAVGALLYAAFGSFQCKKCGTIPRREFPTEVQRQMMLGSLGIIAFAIVLLLVAIVVIALLQNM
jgi:hypothetical protein